MTQTTHYKNAATTLDYLMNLKNPNYWFLLLSSIIMISIAAVCYLLPGKIPFASEGMPVLLYRLNYAMLTWIVLVTGNTFLIRTFAVVTGWIMIFLVLSNWMHFTPNTIFNFTVGDNLLHTNIGLISIFIAVMYGDDTDGNE